MKSLTTSTTNNSNLTNNGWVETPMGNYRTNGEVKEVTGFKCFIRRRNLNTFIDDYSKKASTNDPSKPRKNWASSAGSSSALGNPESKLTPPACGGINEKASATESGASLPLLSSFSDYSSLMAAREEKPCLLIGFDSEWQNIYAGNDVIGRDMLSWQFALVDGEDLVEFIFLKDGENNLPLNLALGVILDNLGKYDSVDIRSIRRYKYCSEWKDGRPVEKTTDKLDTAKANCRYVWRDGVGFTKEKICDMADIASDDRSWKHFITYLDYSKVDSIKVCLVCHYGTVDLTSFAPDNMSLLKHLTAVQGGLVTLQPVRRAPRSLCNVNNSNIYPVSLSVSDTMCHTPTGKKRLQDIGEVIGIEKIDIPKEQKERMQQLLDENIVLFMEYASMDSVITMLYASSIYGYNNSLPVTITSASARVMKQSMMNYLGCSSTEEFDRTYRGLEKANHGKFKMEERPGFVEATSLEPISNGANIIQNYASHAYHGGYNICTEIGSFPFETYDYDLKNAYPTAMCLVPDINWENPIREEVTETVMTLEMFTESEVIDPIIPFVGYVRFEFPETCKYPCIPINVDGIPVYPLSSEGTNGVYTAGPFIWLALQLGATVYCEKGFFLNVRYVDNLSQKSMPLSTAVKQLVNDRNRAKKECGKGSLEELILKVMVNAGYGKNAQNVIEKTSWTAFKDAMENLGCSAITNPVSAMMITSIVQVELIAAQNQINELGYISCSVTTDGFISNIPEKTLCSLSLYGLRKRMESARLFLTDNEDPEIWEIKHAQDDLINFTTRGNVSLHHYKNIGGEISGIPMMVGDKPYEGVCAHNSTKSGFESDSYEDRLWLMTQVLSRTSTVDYVEEEWTSFKEYVQGSTYKITHPVRHIRMDFDMKRKPIRSSFSTDIVTIGDTEYEIAHFDTEPYRDISEFKNYRRIKDNTLVLRTGSDWDIFWQKLGLSSTNAQPRNILWAKLNSCIMGYRMGLWDIPGLKDKTVDEKCAWINAHNNSGKSFNPSDWKNARRPERQANMLPREMIEEILDELMEDNL